MFEIHRLQFLVSYYSPPALESEPSGARQHDDDDDHQKGIHECGRAWVNRCHTQGQQLQMYPASIVEIRQRAPGIREHQHGREKPPTPPEQQSRKDDNKDRAGKETHKRIFLTLRDEVSQEGDQDDKHAQPTVCDCCGLVRIRLYARQHRSHTHHAEFIASFAHDGGRDLGIPFLAGEVRIYPVNHALHK